jgi:hypothetical protein
MYGESQPTSDETSFRVDNTSAAYYNSPYYLLHQKQVQPFPAPRPGAPMQLKLDDFVGPQVISAIQQAGKIALHAVGDTGAAKVDHTQTVARALANQAEVADAMASDLAGSNPPAFFSIWAILFIILARLSTITTSFTSRIGHMIGPFSRFRETTTVRFSVLPQAPRKIRRCRPT